jgi:hypothetical protein
MVADAEALVADEPDVPVLESVTRVATRGNSGMRARVAGLGRLVRLGGNTDPIGFNHGGVPPQDLVAGREYAHRVITLLTAAHQVIGTHRNH